MLGQYLLQLIAARGKFSKLRMYLKILNISEQLEDSENYTLPVIPPPPQFLCVN